MGLGATNGLTQVLATDLVRDGWSAIDRLGDELMAKILKPAGQMKESVLHAIPNAAAGVFTAMIWSGVADAVREPGAVGSSLTFAAGGITVKAAGVYRCSGLITMTPSAGQRGIYLLKNGALVTGAKIETGTSTTATAELGDLVLPAFLVTCAANDVLSLGVQQSSGSAKNTTVAGGKASWLLVEAI